MSTPRTEAQWRRLAIKRQWIIQMLERRIDKLEEEVQEGRKP